MRPTREFNAHMGQLTQDTRLCELKTPLGKDVLVFVGFEGFGRSQRTVRVPHRMSQ